MTVAMTVAVTTIQLILLSECLLWGGHEVTAAVAMVSTVTVTDNASSVAAVGYHKVGQLLWLLLWSL